MLPPPTVPPEERGGDFGEPLGVVGEVWRFCRVKTRSTIHGF